MKRKQAESIKVNNWENPEAITMWDASWLTRHYPGGEYEDYDRIVAELKERGYTAVRIDVFPHYIANRNDGTNAEAFHYYPGYGFNIFGIAPWGGPWTTIVRPRAQLLEFLAVCRKHGIKVALSTWVKPLEEKRNCAIRNADDFLRIWNETMKFIADNGFLDIIYYLDILNEYPCYPCFEWLHLQRRQLTEAIAADDCETTRKKLAELDDNLVQTAVRGLKKNWPGVPVGISLHRIVDGIDYSCCDFIDYHSWAFMSLLDLNDREQLSRQRHTRSYEPSPELSSPAYDHLHPIDAVLEEVNGHVLQYWHTRRDEIIGWLEAEVAKVEAFCRQFGVVRYGSTEGWANAFWYDHPLLSWESVKGVSLLAAEIAGRHGYSFNCSSNFCSPQFPTLWRDVEYHRKVTAAILGRQGR